MLFLCPENYEALKVSRCMQMDYSQTGRSPVIASALVYLNSASLDRPRARALASASPPFREEENHRIWPNSNSFFY